MLLSFEHWFSISDIYYLILTNLFYCLLLMRANVFFCDRLLKFLLPRLVSTVMPSVTLLGLIFSLPRSLKILCPLPTTVMYASCFFGSVISFFIGTFPVLKFCLFVFSYSRFPMWIVLITSWLTLLRMDLWVSIPLTHWLVAGVWFRVVSHFPVSHKNLKMSPFVFLINNVFHVFKQQHQQQQQQYSPWWLGEAGYVSCI